MMEVFQDQSGLHADTLSLSAHRVWNTRWPAAQFLSTVFVTPVSFRADNPFRRPRTW